MLGGRIFGRLKAIRADNHSVLSDCTSPPRIVLKVGYCKETLRIQVPARDEGEAATPNPHGRPDDRPGLLPSRAPFV